MKSRLVLIGPPGVGKGTQCGRLSKHLGVPAISTGDMLRSSRDSRTLDPAIARIIDGGRLAPDDLVTAMVRARTMMADAADGYLLDGYPRTVVQAIAFDEVLAERGHCIDSVIHLHADRSVLMQRLLHRATVQGRVDDVAETIRCRLVVYDDRTDPVLDHYRDQDLVRTVNADQPADRVFESIVAGL